MTSVKVPVSVGELLDKVTILRIKAEKIDDPGKNANVRRELEALVEVCGEAGIDPDDELCGELKAINEKLWDIEDAIREKERQQLFDDGFVELARSVYVTNDQRFAVKSRINEKWGSAIREEKSYREY